MVRQLHGPRKQRTWQHVIADQSINYVERFIIDEGHTAQQMERDYGYDLLMFTYDEQGFVEPGYVALQVKAAQSLQAIGSDYVYDLDLRDYNLWMLETVPVVLVLFDASRRRAYWLWLQRYFQEDAGRCPLKGSKQVRVRIPRSHAFNRRAVALMRTIKMKPRSLALGDLR